MKTCPITFRAMDMRLVEWMRVTSSGDIFVSAVEPGQDYVGAAATFSLPMALRSRLSRAVAAFNAIMDEGETR